VAHLVLLLARLLRGLGLILIGELAEVAPHGIGILAIGIVLRLHFDDLELEGVGVEVQSSPIALSHMQRNVLGVEALDHGLRGLVHKLLGQTQSAIGTLYCQRGDVAMATLLIGLGFLHLGQDIAHNAALVVLGHVTELRPGKSMIEVVLHLVVLGQAQQIAVLLLKTILNVLPIK